MLKLILQTSNKRFLKALTSTNGTQLAINSTLRPPQDMADSEHEPLAERTEDMFQGGRGGKRGGGRGRDQGTDGAKGGRKAGGRMENREVQISKALSTLLRHQAQNAGLSLDTEGFARLDQVVSSHFLVNHPMSRRACMR